MSLVVRSGRKLSRELRHLVNRAARTRASSVYFDQLIARTKNFNDVRWLGHPVWQNILDLWSIQELIAEVRPQVLLETGTNRAGSALFYASLFDLLGSGRVVTVDVERLHDVEHPRIEFLVGDSTEAGIVDRMRAAAAGADGPVLVVLDSDHSAAHVGAEMRAYAPLVSVGSYMVVQDGVIDTLPRFAHARPGPLRAIESFLSTRSDFVIDRRWDNRFLISHHPNGWLRRAS